MTCYCFKSASVFPILRCSLCHLCSPQTTEYRVRLDQKYWTCLIFIMWNLCSPNTLLSRSDEVKHTQNKPRTTGESEKKILSFKKLWFPQKTYLVVCTILDVNKTTHCKSILIKFTYFNELEFFRFSIFRNLFLVMELWNLRKGNETRTF